MFFWVLSHPVWVICYFGNSLSLRSLRLGTGSLSLWLERPQDEIDLGSPELYIELTAPDYWWDSATYVYYETLDFLSINIPFWPFALFAFIRLIQGWRLPDYATKDLCPKCSYDLTGNTSGRCPECGRKINRVA